MVKKEPRLVQELQGLLAGNEPYTIELFRARNYVEITQSMRDAFTEFQKCTGFEEALRVKGVFVLADLLRSKGLVKVVRNVYGRPTIVCTEKDISPELVEKLNIDHLFTKDVDRYLQTFGIVNRCGNSIQISIPGRITFKDNTFAVGFFQYSLIKDAKNAWILIHRCFASYNASLDGEYISNELRQSLLDFLKFHQADREEYKGIISELERILRK